MTNLTANVPRWLFWALLESYVKETPGAKSTQRILDYFALGKIALKPDDATAWCAIFANAALEANEIAGTQSAMARSFERHARFVPISIPRRGCITTFWRGAKTSGMGHVGFYIAENPAHIYVLGGNQADRVGIDAFPKSGASMGFSGYYWPVTVPLDIAKRGPIVLNGSPAMPVSVT